MTLSGGAGGAGGGGGVTTGSGTSGICTGVAATCATYTTHSDCATVGCKWTEDACAGTPLGCASSGTSSTCSTIVGCYWSSLTSTCSGTPADCYTQAEHTACRSQGCSWVPATCSGASLSCAEFPTAFSCAFAGCTWRTGTQTAPGVGGATVMGGRTGTGGIIGAGGLAGTGGITSAAGAPGTGGIVGRGGAPGTGGIVGRGGAPGTGGITGRGGTTAAGGAGGTTIAPTPCGNGTKEPGEQCDCGWDPKNLPTGCKGQNGVFFGDGTGCSRTCTREPTCLDATGKTQACTTSCGDGNIDAGEACDDGNVLDGDGCSSACVVEDGFTCATQTVQDSVACSSGSGQCLPLSMIYRDFQGENVAAGGHPDFPFLGTRYNGSSKPTTICVPNSAGPAFGNDSTVRCWGIVGDGLLNGKPQPGATTTCACQFSDWSIGNSSRIPGGYTTAGNDSPFSDGNGSYQGPGGAGSTLNTTSTAGPYTGTILGYTASSPGGPVWKGTVPAYASATSFNQWFNDDPSVNKTFTGVLELAQVGSGMYRYASTVHLAQGGFFPLDQLNPSQATLCDLWPYWNHGSGSPFWGSCSGDQYLFPPRVVQADCPNQNPLSNGCWVSVSGVRHDSYFTDEGRYFFVYDGSNGISINFYGDDDLFVFINGILLLDLGGIHQALPGKIVVQGEPGDAQVSEGGCLDAAGNQTGITVGSAACSPISGSKVYASTPDDFRVRKVKLGLESGKLYELAIFGADRHPPESNFQLSVQGFRKRLSSCQPN